MLALRITLRQCTTDADSSPVLSIWIAYGVRNIDWGWASRCCTYWTPIKARPKESDVTDELIKELTFGSSLSKCRAKQPIKMITDWRIVSCAEVSGAMSKNCSNTGKRRDMFACKRIWELIDSPSKGLSKSPARYSQGTCCPSFALSYSKGLFTWRWETPVR